MARLFSPDPLCALSQHCIATTPVSTFFSCPWITLWYSFLSFFCLVASTAVDDPRKIVKVAASDGKSGETRDLIYTNCKVIGNGSFGIVFQAKLLEDSNPVCDIAIKKVLQDKRFKVPRPLPLLFQPAARLTHLSCSHQNRELQIMRLVSHPNVVDLKAFFYSNGDKVSSTRPFPTLSYFLSPVLTSSRVHNHV